MGNVIRFRQEHGLEDSYLYKSFPVVSEVWVSYKVAVDTLELGASEFAAYQCIVGDTDDSNGDGVQWGNTAATPHWATWLAIAGSNDPPVNDRWYQVELYTAVGSPTPTELWVDGTRLDMSPIVEDQFFNYSLACFGIIAGLGENYTMFMKDIRVGTYRGGGDIFIASNDDLGGWSATVGTTPVIVTDPYLDGFGVELEYDGASVAGVTASVIDVSLTPGDWVTTIQNPNSVYADDDTVSVVASSAIMEINSISATTAGFAADQDHQLWIQTSRLIGDDENWFTYGIARIDYGEPGYITDVAEWNFDGVDSVSATFIAQAGWEYYLSTVVDTGPTVDEQIESTDPYPGVFPAGETTLSLTRVYKPDMNFTFYAVLSGRPVGGHDLVIDTRIWGGSEAVSGAGGNGFEPNDVDGGPEDIGGGSNNPGGSGGGSNDGPFQGGDFGSGTGQQEDEEMALTLGSFRSRGARAIGLSLGDADDLALLDDFTNEAVEQFLRLTKVHTRLAILSVTAGEADYTLDTEIMSFTDAWYEPSGLEPVLLEITNGRKMQSMRMAQSPAADRPRYISLMGAHLLQFYPTPLSDDDLVHILYVPRPAAMSTTADTPSMTAFGGIPSEFHPTLEAYVKWKLGEFDESIGSKFGAVWKAQWDEGIGLARVSINRKSGVFRGRLIPGRNRPYLNASPGVDSG